ncbi:Secologanin synthase [Rhynchospora pubera]|uniref:Secologanin synthase n=1 Tax=Rhynchospora pubera TaxID=906938 RepID=A0AAV8DLD4_9POAL|nr:Secologanin synthase [Rhynchospora pubera]
MHRRFNKSDSFSHSASSNVGSHASQREDLPLVPCPSCGLSVKKFVSNTDKNPNRVFYQCVNEVTNCKFWKWENQYLSHLIKAKVAIPSIESEVDLVKSEVDLVNFARLEAQLDNLTNELKRKCQDDERQIKALVVSLDNFKMYNCMSAIVIVTLLIMVIALCSFSYIAIGRLI